MKSDQAITFFDDQHSFCVIDWLPSEDGFRLTKFAGIDPVLTSGKEGEWDGAFVWMANVTQTKEGFSMYYSASAEHSRKEIKNIGFAVPE